MSAVEPGWVHYTRGGLNAIDWVVGALVVVAMAAMATVVAVQVGLRYGLNTSLDWADEVSRLAFVWSVFLAIPFGVKRGAHVSMELLTGWLPAGVRRALFRLVSLLAVALMTVVAWKAAILARDQWDEPMSTLDVSAGVFLLPLVIGAAHSVVHLMMGVINGGTDRALPATE